jgi:hypothetical protein
MFIELPDEVNLHIFSFLCHSNQAIANVAMVNQFSYRLVEDDMVWKKKVLDEYNQNIPNGENPKKYYLDLRAKIAAEKNLVQHYYQVYLALKKQAIADFRRGRIADIEQQFNQEIIECNQFLFAFKSKFISFVSDMLISMPLDKNEIEQANKIVDLHTIPPRMVQSVYFADNNQRANYIYLLINILTKCNANVFINANYSLLKQLVEELSAQHKAEILIIAAYYGNLPMVKLLLEVKAPVNLHCSMPHNIYANRWLCPLHGIVLFLEGLLNNAKRGFMKYIASAKEIIFLLKNAGANVNSLTFIYELSRQNELPQFIAEGRGISVKAMCHEKSTDTYRADLTANISMFSHSDVESEQTQRQLHDYVRLLLPLFNLIMQENNLSQSVTSQRF